jgi:predicted N-acetyltransferase YhbS
MPDLLVNLLKLPPLKESTGPVLIRRAQTFELSLVRQFIQQNFSGFANKPVSVFIATREQRIVGFAAYECTRRGFFGPTGVVEQEQRKGIGESLLLSCLWSLREMGYVYAIIGGVGPVHFYQKTVGAIVIPDSEPGIYTDLLK